MAQKPNEQSGVSESIGTSFAKRVLQFIVYMATPVSIVIGILTALVLSWLVVTWLFEDVLREEVPEQPSAFMPDTQEKAVPSRLSKKRESWEERTARFEEEARARRETLARAEGFKIGPDGHMVRDEEYERAREKERRKRRVRRFRWGSPAEERGRIWNVPRGEGQQALETALLRVCMAEADGEPQDCVGIWQVLKNIRNRTCSRDFVRRITECEEDGGETMLSTIRRAQPHILAVPTYKLRNARAGWIRNLETSCEMPKGWRHSENRWDARYGSKICPHTVQLVRHLIKNKLPPSRPGHRLRWLPGRPITWGGRCETKQASCDDRIACARGLARIPGVKTTRNAFWCRPGSPGCRQDAEPICVALGYGHLGKSKNKSGEAAQPEKTETKQEQSEERSKKTREESNSIATSEHPLPLKKTSI